MKRKVDADTALIITLISLMILFACLLVAGYAPSAGLGIAAMIVVLLCYIWSQVDER